jgi:hypothetical protein
MCEGDQKEDPVEKYVCTANSRGMDIPCKVLNTTHIGYTTSK